MKPTLRDQQLALLNAVEIGIVDPHFVRRGESWVVVGKDKESPRTFLARELTKVEHPPSTKVWWGPVCAHHLRREAIELALR